MATYLVTHGDLDGIGAAILASKVHDLAGIYFAEYATIDNYLSSLVRKREPVLKLLITDICPSQSICEDLDTVANEIDIKLFDHHKTRQWVEKYSWATFDSTKCGTKLYYDNIEKCPSLEKYQEFVEAVNAWDMWLLDSTHRPRGEKLNTLLKFVREKEFINLFVSNPNADQEEPMLTLLSFLEKEKKHIIGRTITNYKKAPLIRRDSLGQTYVVVFTTDYVSEICHALLHDDDFDDLKYVIACSPHAEVCSLRTKDPSVDVSDIAKRLGGGGHKEAAGFPYPIRNYIEENIFKMIGRIEY